MKQYTIYEPVKALQKTTVECDETLTPEEVYDYYQNGYDSVKILDTEFDPQEITICGDYYIEENR